MTGGPQPKPGRRESNQVMLMASRLLDRELKEVNDFIGSVFEHDLAVVKEIVNQVLGVGGKRMRPTLLLLSTNLYGGIPRDAIGAASIIEVVHAASLLHDDVVDNATLRRGLESLNVKMNNKVSVLLGDFLFTKAYARLSRIEEKGVAISIADAVAGMSLGQVLEAYYQGDSGTSLEEYFSIIEGKTASLFASSCKIGALIGHAPDKHVKCMAEFGKNFGIAFQIIDDCLDFWGDEKVVGKPIGSDLMEKKFTLPVIYLLDHSNEDDKKSIQEIISLPEIKQEHIEEVLKIMERYDTKQYSYGVAGEFCEKALKNLDVAPEGEAKAALAEIITFTLEREK